EAARGAAIAIAARRRRILGLERGMAGCDLVCTFVCISGPNGPGSRPAGLLPGHGSYGMVTVQLNVDALRGVPPSSDASVTTHEKSPGAAGDAPWQVLNERLSTVAGSGERPAPLSMLSLKPYPRSAALLLPEKNVLVTVKPPTFPSG